MSQMSQNKIYVGNLPYKVREEELQSRFGQYGEIEEVRVIMDRETGRSKGFAFITFATQEAAQAALREDNTEMKGETDRESRKIRVKIAQDNPPGGGAGGRRGSNGDRGDRGRNGGGGGGGRGARSY